jgi:hypothetical protein
MTNLKRGESDLNTGSFGGGRTKLTPKVHRAIISSVRAGNFAGTAALAAGIARSTLSAWKTKADSGIEPYSSLFIELEEVSALAEDEIVGELRSNPDWRAKAWWLEHGPAREAWGAGTGSSATDLAVGLLDILRQRASEALPAHEAEVVEVEFHDTGVDTAHTAKDEQPQD